MLEKLPGAPRRRLDDLPLAAIVLRRVLRATGAQRVVFSANGIREGWYMRHIPAEAAMTDPVLAASREMGNRAGRSPALPPRFDALDRAALLPSQRPAGPRRHRPAAGGRLLAVRCRQP